MILFVSSFLVLFLEIALIRWMPAYVRLLAYFSNFILLATFLGGGLGCLLARSKRNLIVWFPIAQLAVILAVKYLHLEVAIQSSTSIYFTSGTTDQIVSVESTLLLPLLFVMVAALFLTVAQPMGKALASRRPLDAYIVNLLGSLTGVAAFALLSWLETPPVVWFAVAFLAALPLLFEPRRPFAVAHVVMLGGALFIVNDMGKDSRWSPYYRITVSQEGWDTIIAVNNVFHQSMAPVERKEYFYQWPYAVFGDTFDNVLILGAGSGTDVASALRHGARHVDAVEIDPVILALGQRRHPDHPYQDPRVTIINDDARHFLATTNKKYDLIVFALIDSLTVQSSFSSVRLESYMFTEESFRSVRDHLTPRGVLALYNYFREKWLVDRLATTAAQVFGQEPLAHVHQEHAYLAVMLIGPRLRELTSPPALPTLTLAYGQARSANPASPLQREGAVVPATDNWPFLYMRAPELPRHYLGALAIVIGISALATFVVRRYVVLRSNDARRTPNDELAFFCLGCGFMLLETKSIVQFALLWGSTWSSASLAIASVLAMALTSAIAAARIEIRRRAPIVALLIALLAVNYLLPIGTVAFSSRALESLFYGALVFSPVLCAGLLFSSSYKESSSTAGDFGANLLGAMVGGVGEYLSLLTGYRFLLIIVAAAYMGAVVIAERGLRNAD